MPLNERIKHKTSKLRIMYKASVTLQFLIFNRHFPVDIQYFKIIHFFLLLSWTKLLNNNKKQ